MLEDMSGFLGRILPLDLLLITSYFGVAKSRHRGDRGQTRNVGSQVLASPF